MFCGCPSARSAALLPRRVLPCEKRVRSSEGSDARQARWPWLRARRSRCRDFLAGDDLFAFIETGDDLCIDPVADADHDFAGLLAAVFLDDGYRRGTRPPRSVIGRISATAGLT